MKLLGFEITRTKAAVPAPVDQNRGGWYRILESYTNAWQQNVTVDFNSVVSNHAVFACMTLIASDIAKLAIRLVEQNPKTGIWFETTSPAFSPVLRKPNRFQNHLQFYENWVLSKLMRGNTYVLLVRDNRKVVTAQYILDPNRVRPLQSDDGTVFYQIKADRVAGFAEDVTVPASEIIHDRFNCLFHPLVGLSPIYAAGVAATQGLNIQNNSAQFFGNKSQPGGILTAPGAISDETAERLKAAWETKFTGENAGKIAVVGDGLTYNPITMTAEDSQLIEQLKWTADVICSVFHVPPYKIGLGQPPTYNNIQALNLEYYSQALQRLIEDIEACQDDGLGIGVGVSIDGKTYGTEFDIDNLLRMDSVTQMQVLETGKNYFTPNEGRKRINLPPTDGGDAVYRQQQDFSLPALAKRDAQSDPFGKGDPASAAPANDNDDEMQAAHALVEIYKGLG